MARQDGYSSIAVVRAIQLESMAHRSGRPAGRNEREWHDACRLAYCGDCYLWVGGA